MTSLTRVYLVDESVPVLLRNLAVKTAGGYVTGWVDNVNVAYPPWRVHHLESADPRGFDEADG